MSQCWMNQTMVSTRNRHGRTEQGAGADRFQRGGTWAIFMLLMPLLSVHRLVAAAQLERSVLAHSLLVNAKTVWFGVVHGDNRST